VKNSLSFVTSRYQPGFVNGLVSTKGSISSVLSDETHPVHPTLLAPGMVTHVERPWSTSAVQRELQKLVFDLEFRNFGPEAITLQANEAISHTEQVDVERVEAVRRKREEAEKIWARSFLSTKQEQPEATADQRELLDWMGRLYDLLKEMVDNFDKANKKWTTLDWKHVKLEEPNSIRDPKLWPPVKAKRETEDDGTADLDRFVLPEHTPEKEVFKEIYEVLVGLRDDRQDLDAEQILKAAFVLAMNIPAFRYVLRPAELLATTPEPLRVDPAATPIYTRQWPLDQTRLEAARKMLDDLVRQGVVEPASSSWNSPIMIVPKKDGTWRFAIDYRKLNAITEMDPSSVPNAKNFLHSLAGNTWFSVCDMLWGFWQQPLCEADRPKTAFTVPGRKQHQWKVLVMGLRNSPQTQQRVMEGVLAGLDPQRVMCFIDDLMVAGRTFDEQLVYLDLMLRRLTSVGLALKLKKCELLRREVHYLGHIGTWNAQTRSTSDKQGRRVA